MGKHTKTPRSSHPAIHTTHLITDNPPDTHSHTHTHRASLCLSLWTSPPTPITLIPFVCLGLFCFNPPLFVHICKHCSRKDPNRGGDRSSQGAFSLLTSCSPVAPAAEGQTGESPCPGRTLLVPATEPKPGLQASIIAANSHLVTQALTPTQHYRLFTQYYTTSYYPIQVPLLAQLDGGIFICKLGGFQISLSAKECPLRLNYVTDHKWIDAEASKAWMDIVSLTGCNNSTHTYALYIT